MFSESFEKISLSKKLLNRASKQAKEKALNNLAYAKRWLGEGKNAASYIANAPAGAIPSLHRNHVDHYTHYATKRAIQSIKFKDAAGKK